MLNKYVKYSLTCLFLFGFTIQNSCYADNYTGGINELRQAINDASATNFTANTDVNTSSTLGAFQSNDLSVYGNNYNLNGASSAAGFSVYSGKTLSINNFGSLNSDNSIASSIKNFSGYVGSVIYNNGQSSIVESILLNNSSLSDGGAIFNANGGMLSISDSVLDNNTSQSGFGGAIYNATGASTTIAGSTLSNNKAQSNHGGAIYNYGILQINNTAFNNNYANYNGGAIYVDRGESTISNSDFSGNNTNYGYGGAIYNATQSSTNIYDTLFSSNYAAGSNAGAIYNEGNLGVDGSIFDANHANYDGGAIYNNASGVATINNTVFSNNYVINGYGGAIYNSGNIDIKNSNFTDNYTSNRAGAIYNTSQNLTIDNTNFNKNVANGAGGAIFNSNSGKIIIKNSQFNENKTQSSYGGAIYNEGELELDNVNFNRNIATNSVGGAIYNSTGASTLISNSNFSENKTQNNNGGAIYNDGYMKIISTTFDNNYSKNIAGAIFNSTAHTLEIKDSLIKNNNATNHAGAIYNEGLIKLNNVQFDNNISQNGVGGAIYNTSTGNLTIDGSIFKSNKAEVDNGGAIYNNGSLNIYNSTFDSNSANNVGGAIFNSASGKTNSLTNSTFKNNTSVGNGGAIYNESALTIDEVNFSENKSANGVGGAIYATSGSNLNIANSSFISNHSSSNNGGAIYNDYGKMTVSASVFNNNSSSGSGGAIINRSAETTNISNSSFALNSSINGHGGAIYNASKLVLNNTDFLQNTTTNGVGGAIYNESGNNLQITGSDFIGNKSINNSGGAIYNDSATMTISDSNFSNNTAKGAGGAIYNYGTTYLLNTSFTNNSSSYLGGAIYNAGNLNIAAKNQDVIFNNNRSNGSLEDIYLADSSILNLNTDSNSKITFNGKINSYSGSNTININKSNITLGDEASPAPTGGSVIFNNAVSGTNVNLYNGTMVLGIDNALTNSSLNLSGGYINMINGKVGSSSLTALNLADGTTTNIGIDVDPARHLTDRFTAASIGNGTGTLNIKDINLLSDINGQSASLLFAEGTLKDQVTMTANKALSPILTYDINYDATSGKINFIAGGGGSYRSYNPQVLSQNVSSLTGTYINQTNIYGEVLGRAESFMAIPLSERKLLRYQNRYAFGGEPSSFLGSFSPYQNSGIWMKQYTTFENIPLKNGPTVSNIGYGVIIGKDSKLKHFENGVDGCLTGYVSYNGSHQGFSGIGMYQDGGLLGFTAAAYKGNAFSALTVNAGGSAGRAITKTGTDNFTTLIAGTALKVGYNLSMLGERFAAQPTYSMSYTYANTFDYRTSSGIEMSSSPLNAIQISPGVRFFYNAKRGWQPYWGTSIVWNLMDDQKFTANNVELPQMSVEPYVEYGLGIQRRSEGRLNGFAQAMARSGGRQGVSLQFGLRLSI